MEEIPIESLLDPDAAGSWVQGRLTEEQERADSAAQAAKQHLADAKSELQEAWSECDGQQDTIQQLEVRV